MELEDTAIDIYIPFAAFNSWNRKQSSSDQLQFLPIVYYFLASIFLFKSI